MTEKNTHKAITILHFVIKVRLLATTSPSFVNQS